MTCKNKYIHLTRKGSCFFDIVFSFPTLLTIILKLLRISRSMTGVLAVTSSYIAVEKMRRLATTKTPVRYLGILSNFRMTVLKFFLLENKIFV